MGEDLKQEERETNLEQHDIDIFQNQIQGIGPFFLFFTLHKQLLIQITHYEFSICIIPS